LYRVINGKRVQEVPDVYVDYILCKHFSWTPNQLDEQDDEVITAFVEIINLINEREDKELKKLKR
jgi:hypothetical protein